MLCSLSAACKAHLFYKLTTNLDGLMVLRMYRVDCNDNISNDNIKCS